ncbi:glycoside hydrolase family 38 N-terminal domain-containing protein [Mycolicibacterium arseniciresistens]|uniref:NEW3 domain-containing protein n=1 Tax=Mycolicibacterium arseniciresistens TaxID=3062257 RepID=A0ABT8UA40_9MYCO|nr:NEW3 domain-containing protein [Mycolicibacterium arseniciresistens]MDO3634658.1 NEW3 domain-containing protein [Mycolicibacterium arseniciresistens]
MHVTSAESTELFVGPPGAPLQIVRVSYTGGDAGLIAVQGDGLAGEVHTASTDGTAEVPVAVADPVPGEQRAARAGDTEFVFTVAEPGWTMHMISHFHYDPVWWNTQAAYTSQWTEDPPGRCRQTHSFDLVAAHLEMARREPEYKFVLAEVDYLKPYWDTHPEDRADLRAMIADGRVEVMGGTYNEPNTNLTSAETTIRNFVCGMGFQRDVLGASPTTAWQLDAFGHDPQFPGMAADAGLTSSSWARGPHHQWGPMADDGDPERMQFSSEFEWIAPSGRGLLTHYMPAHYAAGWWMDSAPSLAEAEAATLDLFQKLKRVALTRNVLLPVGTDYTPPNKWVTQIHRDWAARYTWPRFVCALPAEFFAAVRAELVDRGVEPSPQTRDMNPIYTGKDVSYIDTKQANRAAEDAVLDAERFAVFAGLVGGATYPQAALAKAWVQLAYGAHHDAITGSESDQVYLDLLTGWRDAWQLGTTTRDNALTLLSRAVGDHTGPDGRSVVVWNTLTHNRDDIVTVRLDEPVGAGVCVRDTDGAEVPALVEDDGHTVSWLARDMPSLGWRSYRLAAAAPASGWDLLPDNVISNEYYRLQADPARGGGVVSLVEAGAGRDLIAPGAVGNELAVYDEYPAHPKSGEGPWHLLPSGPVTGSSAAAAEVTALRSALGERLVVRGAIPGVLRYTQTLTLWRGVARVDCRTTIDEFTGADKLLRLRWPCPVPGGLPVSEVADAVIGRGFGLLHDRGAETAVDSAAHPWTLDNPAYGWFGLSSAVRVRIGAQVCPVGVAEVVTPAESLSAPTARDLVVALARAGVTATCSSADKSRYGDLAVDSNLPDTRIALGGPDQNAFTAAVLDTADPTYGQELQRQLRETGSARVWVSAAASPATAWVPGADLRAVQALPVLIVAGPGAVAALVDDLDDAEITVDQQAAVTAAPFEAHTVAVLNRGVPGFAVDPDGTLHTSLMRSCTGWPSGTWIDPPRRTAPDGSNFQLQHWTHTFDYALVSGAGDWRDADVPARSAAFSHPLLAVAGHGEPEGGLPPWGSLLTVEPAASVTVGAIKAAGNPLAAGSVRQADPSAGVVLRLVETRGGTADVVLHSGLRTVSDATRVDLLEQPLRSSSGHDRLRLHGFEIATVSTRLNLPRVLDGEPTMLAPESEAAQPLFARYWLHNRGPAPLGGLPAVAHLHPDRTSAEPGSAVRLRLTAASDCTDAALHGHVRLVLPTGWTADPAELPFVLPPGEHLTADLAVQVPAQAGPGLYPVRAELAVTGADIAHIPESWRQTVEDICIVEVGPVADTALLKLVAEPSPVDIVAGESATLSATVGSDALADLSVEAHLISPWGTWEWMGPAAVGANIPASGSVELSFDVRPPVWLDPGEWWALIRVAGAGRLLYTSAVKVVVR